MITLSYRIDRGDFDFAGLATRMLKERLARAGVDAPAMRRVMIASYEAEMNVVIHARTGTLWARLDGGKLDLEIADEGPGEPRLKDDASCRGHAHPHGALALRIARDDPTVSLTSVPGEGSEFIVRIPAAASPQARAFTILHLHARKDIFL